MEYISKKDCITLLNYLKLNTQNKYIIETLGIISAYMQ